MPKLELPLPKLVLYRAQFAASFLKLFLYMEQNGASFSEAGPLQGAN